MSCEAKENCENIYLAKDLNKVADEYIFNKKTLKISLFCIVIPPYVINQKYMMENVLCFIKVSKFYF